MLALLRKCKISIHRWCFIYLFTCKHTTYGIGWCGLATMLDSERISCNNTCYTIHLHMYIIR